MQVFNIVWVMTDVRGHAETLLEVIGNESSNGTVKTILRKRVSTGFRNKPFAKRTAKIGTSFRS